MSEVGWVDGAGYVITPTWDGNKVIISGAAYETSGRERMVKDGELTGLLVKLRELPGGKEENVLVEYHNGISEAKHGFFETKPHS